MRLSLVLAVLLWLIVILIDVLQLLAIRSDLDLGIRAEIPRLIEALFYVFIVIYYRFKISNVESGNFVDLLWRVFATGLVTTIISLIFRLFYSSIDGTALANNEFLITALYDINKALISVFLISTFTVWKRLILYQKSKRLVFYWNTFEAGLMFSILFNLTGYNLQSHLWFQILFVALGGMSIVLSGNLKWVAYLNFKQKWKSILLILLIIIYIFYFFSYLYTPPEESLAFLQDIDSLFLIVLFTFLTFYSIFSLLVILFNLPTSSVFEQKMEEAINFQRLSQSIQQGENEDEIFDVLLTSSMSAVYADAGWIEINSHDKESKFIAKHISREKINQVKEHTHRAKSRTVMKNPFSSDKDSERVLITLKKSTYRSVFIVPITVKSNVVGFMYLLNEVTDGFNKEMINIINTFASQASVSVENFRLMGEAIENERYKEELNIAKSVQRALLPEQLDHNDAFQIHAFTEAAAEVGGDYYDTFKLSNTKFAIVIGDVSGKGTSAAFHMSQMKGIFQSLVQLDLSPKEFLIHANTALSKCLERTSFITLTYYIIDTEKREIEYARAGHCPTLYYDKQKKEADFFQNKGLGLGIMRNDSYKNFIEVNKISFNKEDILVLYTDGISEATNSEKDEFGFERMKSLLEKNAHYDPVMIQKVFISKLYEFCERKDLDDDYTIVVIKFK
ncbi:GAF domain-containing SpoIIE family protein phosphatase [Roseivirga pacifica]|uniref:GAF domain-containing SpoIIE family protein phosphatase n=1 Tax=Roseivirga pacifica TaxID=1267423 RepID=UPI002096002E|nr:GAF domain-containing SpoIIE family protein phosphatase [Roseivirga pacifica]MCO6359524.1 SpoIIE family protein phosphatase [Roseivirga pacifica]MCO6366894.1 SpoIIE family protein phosphatase [Roseivirga pacifica]MCO6370574.1 SpoIIE family protein phosphatase [Roseivirga pacifica]MCO6374551.1 SpoIIE family protein phosphatase [Roseivirga pacifica]MCO6379809.1 SpoIIE family protein phosphatase [Roseivirga pacifica]